MAKLAESKSQTPPTLEDFDELSRVAHLSLPMAETNSPTNPERRTPTDPHPPVDANCHGPYLRVMGDKSPKATQKHAAQRQVKAAIAKQKKDNAATARQVTKIKK